jgi:integrase
MLLDFHDALVVEELLRDPRSKLKHTIACWNMGQSKVPDWPEVRLASPFKRDTYKLPLEVFPKSFASDVERWERRLLHPDVMDPGAPDRPLKKITVEGHRTHILRFASALVHCGAMNTNEITELSVLVADIERVKKGLRFFLKRNSDKTSPHIAKMADVLRAVAKYHVRLPEDRLEQLEQLCKRLRRERPVGMTDRNRAKLRQFDDPKKVAALLNFPAAEARRGRQLKNAYRAAKCFERAVAVSLLIATGLRMKNLRTLELRGDLSWIDKSCYLSIPAERVKNGVPLDFELPEETATLLREYIDDYRPFLPGSGGNYLFSAGNGGRRCHSTMAIDIKTALRKRAGLNMNAHLFRHAIAKIVIERDPGLAFTISRHLGHKRMDTTMQSYLGTEGRAVGRRIDSVISAARRNPSLPGEQA